MTLTLFGRRGFFLALNVDGFESDVLTPQNADRETSGFRVHPVRLVWCFFDELSVDRPPVYHGVLDPAPASGAWVACESWLLEQEAKLGVSRPTPRL